MVKIYLWEKRNEYHVSLRELERLTGISKTKLNYIENDKVSPTLDELELIAKALNIRINDLFESDYK